ncbi:DUF3883 domain-containing protein [Zobellia nedashkovskayae]|uniref:DUF3883 domain-containing protein n=1 Tax=Zobellia nedashkovskayae TaxID=2779510 RepID=UPI00188BC30D|nr:DUF3883 domain-containing protein [Zobellia nedashkovskayae]
MKKLDYKFVDDEKELVKSTIEFFNKPEFWKIAVGKSPKYFVHVKQGKKHNFGLSKFCAFKDITVEEYISIYRGKIGGNPAQKHIVNIIKQDWTPRVKISSEIREKFDNWILKFYPNYNVNNASFITVSIKKDKQSKKTKFIDPVTLEKRLKLQREIGEVGEEIALNHEITRLELTGIKNAEKFVEHTSKLNAGAGFDITSSIKKDNRFIEVKSSTNKNLDFFITENEYLTLDHLGKAAFIYFVYIEDLKERKGRVLRTIQNPIKELRKNGNLRPIAYKSTLNI